MNFDSQRHVLHFAYGAEMNQREIAARCSSAKVVSIACLKDHRLAFFGHSTVWDGAEESVVPETGCEVHGVVYRLTHGDADRLDASQGVRLNGTGSYFHSPADVVAPDGTVHSVVMFRKDVQREPRLPSQELLDQVVSAAMSHGLPAQYIEWLRHLPACPASYPVPYRPQAGLFTILNGSVCAC